MTPVFPVEYPAIIVQRMEIRIRTNARNIGNLYIKIIIIIEKIDKNDNFLKIFWLFFSFFDLFEKIIFKITAIPIPIINPIPKLFFIIAKSFNSKILASGSPIKTITAPPKNHTNVFTNPKTYPIPTKRGDT